MKNYRLQDGCFNCVNCTIMEYPWHQLDCDLTYNEETGEAVQVHESGICDLHEKEEE